MTTLAERISTEIAALEARVAVDDEACQHLREMYANAPVWVTVLHGSLQGSAEALSKELTEKLNVARLEVRRISPVLGVHTGPGVVGAAVVPMRLIEDLLH